MLAGGGGVNDGFTVGGYSGIYRLSDACILWRVEKKESDTCGVEFFL